MNVLIAVDDQVFANALADFACRHEWPATSEFKVIHVVEPILLHHDRSAPFMKLLEQNTEEQLKAARSLVRNVALKLRERFKSPRVHEEIIEGHPIDVILQIAETWPADFILLGSHGRNGLGRFVLGSVSMEVAGRSRCPVLVLKPARTATG